MQSAKTAMKRHQNDLLLVLVLAGLILVQSMMYYYARKGRVSPTLSSGRRQLGVVMGTLAFVGAPVVAVQGGTIAAHPTLVDYARFMSEPTRNEF